MLASILWKIAFNADRQAWLKIGETFKVNFTEKGFYDIYPLTVSQRNYFYLFNVIYFTLQQLNKNGFNQTRYFYSGQIIANECNIPEELISSGKCPEWSNSEHLDNLRQLSRCDIEDHPLPNTRTSTPLHSGQKGKGVGKRRKIIT